MGWAGTYIRLEIKQQARLCHCVNHVLVFLQIWLLCSAVKKKLPKTTSGKMVQTELKSSSYISFKCPVIYLELRIKESSRAAAVQVGLVFR